VASLVDVVIVIENDKKVGGRRSYMDSVIKPESAQGGKATLEWFQSKADIRQDSNQRSRVDHPFYRCVPSSHTLPFGFNF
jgi:hypothetical protein